MIPVNELYELLIAEKKKFLKADLQTDFVKGVIYGLNRSHTMAIDLQRKCNMDPERFLKLYRYYQPILTAINSFKRSRYKVGIQILEKVIARIEAKKIKEAL